MDRNGVHVVRESFLLGGNIYFLFRPQCVLFLIFFILALQVRLPRNQMEMKVHGMGVYLDGKKCTFCSINALQLSGSE